MLKPKFANRVPVLPIRNAVAFPGVGVPFLVRRAFGVSAIQKANATGKYLIAVAQRDGGVDDPSVDDLYKVGTLMKIEKVVGSVEQGYQIWVRGEERVRLDGLEMQDGYWGARYQPLEDLTHDEAQTIDVLFKSLKDLAHEVIDLLPGDTEEMQVGIDKFESPSLLAYLCANYMEQPVEKKQEFLENLSLKSRLLTVLEWMRERRETLSIEGEIRTKMSKKFNRNQREAILREQLRTIREELGDEGSEATDDLRSKIEKAEMPDDVRKIADQELKRLEAQGQHSAETNVIRSYLETLVAMPWKKTSEATLESLDLDAAQAALDEDHYGLEKIKKRILQHLAVMKLKKESQGSILLFVGPPGVGKTSLGQSIARALGRKFVRASLGGMRDDSEIRGHRRTYVGAMPGRIIQGLKRAGEKNPVFMLDEIDKLSYGVMGDPASALLEVLDPEQNKAFMDHYLDVTFDLSEVFFIATANSLESIPAPLLDRMEVIHLSGYTTAEKSHIARKYLIPKETKKSGLPEGSILLGDDVLTRLISSYTREAGVRDLQRKVGELARASAERVLRSKDDKPVAVTFDWLEEVLGPERFVPEVSERQSVPGVTTGLAWTPHGGDILFIEVTAMPGSGKLTITGQLGDVMKESAQIALSLARSNLPELAPGFDFEKKDVHIHVPAGAIPKDGPSAGVTILTAVTSLFTGQSVSPELGMTGEITLRGAVLPVGGIKEKLIAAHRAGIKRILLPLRNKKDLRDVPEEVRSQLQIEFVENTSDVLRLALGISQNRARVKVLGNFGLQGGEGSSGNNIGQELS